MQMCPTPLAGELDLMWTQAASPLRVCGQLWPWRGWDWRRQRRARCGAVLPLSDKRGLIPSCCSRIPEGEPELAPFPLRMAFLLSLYWKPMPQSGQCWSKWDTEGGSVLLSASDRGPSFLCCAECAPTIVSLTAQTQPRVQIPLSLTADHCSQPPPPLPWGRTPPRGRGTHVDFQRVCGGEWCWTGCRRDLGCLCKGSTTATTTSPRPRPELGGLCIPHLNLLPSCGCLRSSVPGNLAASRTDLPPLWLGGEASAFLLLTSWV